MANGMSFIGNRWVYTGPQSYVSEPASDGTGDYVVWSVNAAGKRAVARRPDKIKADELVKILKK